MKQEKPDAIRRMVRLQYGQVATRDADAKAGGCGPSCCGASGDIAQISPERLGYSRRDLANAPSGSNLGLGCGNPCSFAALQPGESVLDLGSGAGGDCFLAAQQVGPSGQVIGVDMTPEMVARAQKNKETHGYSNVDFRLGQIEHLPVESGSIDVVLSNCVINLSPDKARVYAELYRVLRPGGRVAISDIVSIKIMPESFRADMSLYSC